MESKIKMKSLLKFYRNKLKNKYYDNEAERIRIEEKIKHFEKILGEWWEVEVKIINVPCDDVWYARILNEIVEVENDDLSEHHYKFVEEKYNSFIRKIDCELLKND